MRPVPACTSCRCASNLFGPGRCTIRNRKVVGKWHFLNEIKCKYDWLNHHRHISESATQTRASSDPCSYRHCWRLSRSSLATTAISTTWIPSPCTRRDTGRGGRRNCGHTTPCDPFRAARDIRTWRRTRDHCHSSRHTSACPAWTHAGACSPRSRTVPRCRRRRLCWTARPLTARQERHRRQTPGGAAKRGTVSIVLATVRGQLDPPWSVSYITGFGVRISSQRRQREKTPGTPWSL